MNTNVFVRAIGLALLSLALTGPAFADIKDYEFQLVRDEMKMGEAMVDSVCSDHFVPR